MHQNLVAIFCNIHLLLGQVVERERESESKSSNFYEVRFNPKKFEGGGRDWPICNALYLY
jgi:hypothetical protein